MRYFTDGKNVWMFDPEVGMSYFGDYDHCWTVSVFRTVEELLYPNPGVPVIHEINEHELRFLIEG